MRINEFLVFLRKLNGQRIPHKINSRHCLFWSMFREIIPKVFEEGVLSCPHTPEIAMRDIPGNDLGHSSNEQIGLQQIRKSGGKRTTQGKVLLIHGLRQPALPDCQQKFMKRHWPQGQPINFPDWKSSSFVFGQSQKRPCRNNEQVSPFFAEIFECGQCPRTFLNLIKNNKRILWRNLKTNQNLNSSENARQIVICFKERAQCRIIVKPQIGRAAK